MQRAKEYSQAKEKYQWHINKEVVLMIFSLFSNSAMWRISSEGWICLPVALRKKRRKRRRLSKFPCRSTRKWTSNKTKRSTRWFSDKCSNLRSSTTLRPPRSPPPRPKSHRKRPSAAVSNKPPKSMNPEPHDPILSKLPLLRLLPFSSPP